MKRIAVERGLSDIADYLSNKGFSVEMLGESLENNALEMLDGYDAIITADFNTDMLGISNTTSKVPVINASGLTPEEILKMIEQKPTR